MTQSTGNRPDQSNDQIIATAFRYSVGVIVLIVAVVMLARYLLGLKPDEPVIEDATADAPTQVPVRAPVDPTTPLFVNITASSGLDFVHRNGAIGDRMLPETMGGGVAFIDHDGDGDQDILLVSSSDWPWDEPAGAAEPSVMLYDNDGNGSFSRVADSGLDTRAYAMGVTVGDIDADGDPDLYVTTVGQNLMYRNDGNGRFTDISLDSGTAGSGGWSSGAALVDVDADQDLDLFVIDYVIWSREIDLKANYQLTGIGRAYGPPTNFEGSQPALFINDGTGSFTDESIQRGIHVSNAATGVAVAKSLAIMPLDLDGDSDTDLFVANDTTRNFAYINDGQGVFVEEGELRGLAFDNMGKSTGAMGVDVSWTPEGAPMLAVGNFANEMTSVYSMDPATGNFSDDAVLLGIGARSRAALTFGVLYFDYDLDGREDLFQANGHVEDEINRVQPSQTHAQLPQLFWNCGLDCDREYQPIDASQLSALATPLIGRGAAYADIDGDGDLDLLIGQTGAAAQLYRNDTESGNWLRLDISRNDANTGALGCSVSHDMGGQIQKRLVQPTRSYLSQVETVITFGLGAATESGVVLIECPDGTRHEAGPFEINRLHSILIE